MKKIICFILIICTLFACCACGNNEDKEIKNAGISFLAVDGVSGLPLANVKVVLPEYDTALFTNSEGRTEEIMVDALYDTRSEKVLLQDYGTLTVLAYKEEYNDYALFYAQVVEYESRRVKIYMFKKDTPLGNGAPLATIESPDKKWVENVVEKYRNFE